MLGLRELQVNLNTTNPIDAFADVSAWCELACLGATEACLDELQTEHLTLLVQLSLDCAEVCSVTRRFLTDALVAAPALVQEQLESCALICAACAAESRKHDHLSYQLRACARSCARCEQLCWDLMRRVARLD